MRYGSVCSGVEAATLAWHPLGWEASFYSEIEKFPRAVLAHHYPDTPLHGDFTTIGADEYEPIDLLVGGTPCQSFSVAGLRKGMADDRGNLALEFLKLAERTRAQWVVWENVPGVLSSNGGRDLGSFLGGLGEIGYGYAYRILNAQYFGVPQRRRRIFLVGYLGDWRPPVSVLFERQSLYGHPPPSRKERQTIAEETGGSPPGRGWPVNTTPTLNAAFGEKQGLEDQHALGGAGLFVPHSVMSDGQANATVMEDGTVPTLTCINDAPVVAGALTAKGPEACGAPEVDGGHYLPFCADVAPTLTSSGPPFSQTGNSRVEAEAMVVMPINTMVVQGRPGDDGRMGSGIGEDGDPSPTITANHSHAVAFDTTNITSKENGSNPQPGDPCFTLAKGQHPPLITEETHCLQGAGVTSQNSQGSGHKEDTSFTLNVTDVHGVAQVWSIMPQNNGKDYKARMVNICQPLMAAGPTTGNQGGDIVQQAMQVRRLTPVECERLQGFPDNFTRIPYRGKSADKCPDGPRYKAMGNSMAVPCMAWIGKRIDAVHKRLEAQKNG